MMKQGLAGAIGVQMIPSLPDFGLVGPGQVLSERKLPEHFGGAAAGFSYRGCEAQIFLSLIGGCRARLGAINAHRGCQIAVARSKHGDGVDGQAGGPGVDEENRGALTAALLDFPGLAAVDRSQDGAEVTDRPSPFVVREEKTVQGKELAG